MNRENVYEEKFRYYYIFKRHKQKFPHGIGRSTAGII